jgi:hypothetical protein
MTINPLIFSTFKEYNIPSGDGILCLLSIHYDLSLSSEVEKALDPVAKQINVSHIVERDFTNKEIRWNIPLFQGVETQWDWVNTEYRSLFLRVRKDRGGSTTSCLKRMKDFFSHHPEVRKEDVI